MLPGDLDALHGGEGLLTERNTHLYPDGYEVRFHYGGLYQPVHEAGPGREREYALLRRAQRAKALARHKEHMIHGGGGFRGGYPEMLAEHEHLVQQLAAADALVPPHAHAPEGVPPPPLPPHKTMEQIRQERHDQWCRESGAYDPVPELPPHLREPEQLPPPEPERPAGKGKKEE